MFYVFVEEKLRKKQRKKPIKSTAKKLQNETGNLMKFLLHLNFKIFQIN